MMGGYGYGPGGGTWGIVGFILNFLFVLLIVVGVIFLIWWLVRQFSAAPMHHEAGLKAVETLKERYAKGEISKEQFEQMKKDIAS